MSDIKVNRLATGVENAFSYSASNLSIQFNIYDTRLYGGGGYLHLKTNIPKNSNRMFMIEAVGYNYGQGQNIRCAHCGYPYSGSGTIISSQSSTLYPGMTADGLYYSSDDYVVLRYNTSSTYYWGCTWNAYSANPSANGHQVEVLAFSGTAGNSEAGAYY